jgi:hypothetical protein
MSEEERIIKALRKEARSLNAKSKAKVKASGLTWLPMDADDMADFRRYMDIQVEIEKLKGQKP